MDLPDPSERKKDEVPQLNDANTMFVFQEHVNKITDVKEDVLMRLRGKLEEIMIKVFPDIYYKYSKCILYKISIVLPPKMLWLRKE